MKTKSLLMLLALTGIHWSINATAASSTVAPTSIDLHPALSHSISELVGLDRDTHSLLELAIDRALIAQQVNGGKQEPQITAGSPAPVPQPPVGVSVPVTPPPTDKKPKIDSKTTNPKDLSIDRSKLKTVKKKQCKLSKSHK